MAYDEGLAERIRGVFDDRPGITEKKMFGGVAFMVRGHMTVGIVKDELMVRVGPEAYEKLVHEPHARRMDFTGRPMKGFLFVAPEGLERDADLERWIERGLQYATSLPEQSAPTERRAKARPRGARR
jgi:TfoX/Sxy family transcriptional regulator of competence genes